MDYTKIVIIDNPEYLGSNTSYIDKDEFIETLRNFARIKKDALKYVENYIKYHTGEQYIRNEEFLRRYSMSSLQYFHKELGIGKPV